MAAHIDDRASLHALLQSKNVEASALDWLDASYIVTDPEQADNPTVWVSPAFLALTGYTPDEVLGRNCRFLQGPDTDPQDVADIRELIAEQVDGVVSLLNYRKDGTPFHNLFAIFPLRDGDGKLVLYAGAQCDEDGNIYVAGAAAAVEEHPSNCRIVAGEARAAPNGQALPWRTPYSQGVTLFKTRGAPVVNPAVAAYFDQRNRMFELQVQFQLLDDVPPGHEIFVGGEIRGPMVVGWASRMVCSTIIGVLRMFNATLHHSFGCTEPGREEYPHLSFPFRVLPDELIITAAGDSPPPLTLGDLPAAGRAPPDLVLQKGPTYTLSFFSQFIDFEAWNIIRLPGVSTLSLKTFWGENPLYIVAYAVPAAAANHLCSERRLLFEVCIEHASLSPPN